MTTEVWLFLLSLRQGKNECSSVTTTGRERRKRKDDALMMIQQKQYVVPVVDKENTLLGAISFFSVLYALREEYDRETVEALKAKERAERKKRKEEEAKS